MRKCDHFIVAIVDRKEGVINSTWKRGWGQERLEGRGNTQAVSLYGLKVGDTETREKGLPDTEGNRLRRQGGSKDKMVDAVK